MDNCEVSRFMVLDFYESLCRFVFVPGSAGTVASITAGNGVTPVTSVCLFAVWINDGTSQRLMLSFGSAAFCFSVP